MAFVTYAMTHTKIPNLQNSLLLKKKMTCTTYKNVLGRVPR